jgi:hypothetical protein
MEIMPPHTFWVLSVIPDVFNDSRYCHVASINNPLNKFNFTQNSRLSFLNFKNNSSSNSTVHTIDLVSVDQQSVGKTSLHLMDIVNAKNLLASQQFLTESHIVTRLAYERASFLNMNDINVISFFGTSDCYHSCSIA